MKIILFLTLFAININGFGQTAGEYFMSGIEKFAHQDYIGAIADFNNAIELKPDNALCYRMRGNSKRNLEDYRGAIADYNKSIELTPDDADTFSERGQAKFNLQDFF